MDQLAASGRRTTTRASRRNRSRQADYNALLVELVSAILDVDMYAWDEFVDRGALSRLKRQDAQILWYLCWWSWCHSRSSERRALHVCMTTMQALHPGLRVCSEPWGTTSFSIKMKRTPRSQQECYEHLLEAFFGAILEVDTWALDGFVDSEALRHLKRKDVNLLWHVCRWSWWFSEPPKRMILGTFMACMKAFYPWLDSSGWMMEVDPEAV